MKNVARFVLDSGLNMALRGLTLVSKFFLLVYLAKALAPEQLGVYGLFTVTISYALYLLGLDFYTYAHREMLSLPHTAWSGIIRNQFVFYGVIYLIVLPLLLLIFLAGCLPWQLIGWFYLILTFEHLSQELYRLLVVCGKVTLANVSLFLRSGAWAYVVLALFRLKPELHGLNVIWAGWTIGVAMSIVISIIAVLKVIGPAPERTVIDWRWMRRGVNVATQFLVGTLALRGLFTFDRYFVDLYVGKSVVGVYSFYMSIANAVLSFADAGVISRLYPRIVAAYRAGRYTEYHQHMKKLAFGIVLLYSTFSVGLFVTIKPVLHYIGREIYLEQVTILWGLLAAMWAYSLGLVPHYALYARGADRAVFVASVLSLLIFIVTAIYLTPVWGGMGMAVSVLVGVGCLGCLKVAFSVRAYKAFTAMYHQVWQ